MQLRRTIASLEQGEQNTQTESELNFLRERLAVLETVKSKHERSRGSLHSRGSVQLPPLSLLKDDNDLKRPQGKASDPSRKTRSPNALKGVRSVLRNTIHFGESAPSLSDESLASTGAKSARVWTRQDKRRAEYDDLLNRRARVAEQLRKLDRQIAQEAKNLGVIPPKLGLPPPKPPYAVPPLPNFGSGEQVHADSPQTARPRLETTTPPSSL